MVKRWMLAFLWVVLTCLVALPAHAIVEIAHPVTDPNEYLTRAERDAISDVLLTHRNNTQTQIAVLLVSNTEGRPIEDYAHEVATRWGGGQRGQDRGALVLFAIGDRRSRIEVGYGLESTLTDGVTRQLLDEARSYLRNGNYGGAAAFVVDGLVQRTGGTPGAMAALTTAQNQVGSRSVSTHSSADNNALLGLFLVLGVLVLLALLIWYFASSDNNSYSVSSGGSSYYPSGGSPYSGSSTTIGISYSSSPSYSSGYSSSSYGSGSSYSSSSSYDSSSSSSSYDSSSSYSSSSYDSSSSSSYDSSSSSSSYDSGSSYSSSDSSYSGGGGDFGGGGSSSDW